MRIRTIQLIKINFHPSSERVSLKVILNISYQLKQVGTLIKFQYFHLGKTLLVNTNLYHLKTILSSLLRYGLYLGRSYCICPIQNNVFGMFNIWNEYVRIMPCYNFLNLLCGSANMYIFNDYVMCKFWIYRLAATLAGNSKFTK